MASKCPKCSKMVYYAEQVLADGEAWHKRCFVCDSCGRSLDSRSCTPHDGKLFCKSCHGKTFGPKGYGFGVGAGTLSMDTGDRNSSTPAKSNIPKTAQAYAAPANDKSMAVPAANRPKWGGADICQRCGKTVYFAEKMLGAGAPWHKVCFTCKSCNKRLESTTVTEREGQIYCKACYGKMFGPKGYGYGGGAGTLSMKQ